MGHQRDYLAQGETGPGLYRDRTADCIFMGESDRFPCCDGKGWRTEWRTEVARLSGARPSPGTGDGYCDCACGVLRRKLEA